MIGASAALADAQSPYWVQSERVWRITRYADIAWLLKHDAVEILDIAGWLRRLSARAPAPFSNLMLLFEGLHPLQNGEAHAKSRARARAFVTELTRNWPPERLQALAVDLLAVAARAADADAVTLLADPYAATIAASELKMDVGALLQCKRLEQQLLQVYHHATPPLRHLNALEATAGTVVRLLREQFPEAPPEDYGLISFLTMAAVDSTSSLLANALAFLSRNEALQDRLCARPEFINGFITEMLRYWPPLKRIQGRRATTDIELGGRIIPRGATLTFDLVAAHFDASAYPEPERFDIDRKGPPPLAFGGGPHMCLGAALTRVEGRSFLEALCRDWIVRPAGEPRRAESPDFSDFDSVPIRLDAR